MPGNMSGRRHPEVAARLSANLRRARAQRGVSQDTVARNTGIARSAISDIEAGQRGVSAIELWELSAFYAVSVDSLLDTAPCLSPVGSPTLADALKGLRDVIVNDSRVWADHKRDAWIYAVLVGWGCEDDHEHDWICGGDDALVEVAEKHGWNGRDILRLRHHRAALRTLEQSAGATQTADEPARNDPGSSAGTEHDQNAGR